MGGRDLLEVVRGAAATSRKTSPTASGSHPVQRAGAGGFGVPHVVTHRVCDGVTMDGVLNRSHIPKIWMLAAVVNARTSANRGAGWPIGASPLRRTMSADGGASTEGSTAI